MPTDKLNYFTRFTSYVQAYSFKPHDYWLQLKYKQTLINKYADQLCISEG